MRIKKPDQYCLLPCSGRERLNLKRGHVYKVEDPNDNEIGFMSMREAIIKFGADKIFISSSDTLCPTCYEDI